MRVEFGCGEKKENGYIGVDRFLIPGVDIIADLNYTFPFEDNSVDEVWACHSLEHLEDISHVFSEIFRISKHKSIIQILAPYYFTTLNVSNFHHKSVWTEDTPRLFDIYPTEKVKQNEYFMPHGITWGLGRSDNSNFEEVFQIAKEEFFYFPEYCHLSDELRCQARRSMLNVCDQVYYVLVVNKSANAFTEQELDEAIKRAENIEPDIIMKIRERDRQNAAIKSETVFDKIAVLEDKVKMLEDKIYELSNDVNL